MDFSLETYKKLLETLLKKNYKFQTFKDYLNHPDEKVVILRHDVDKLPNNSLKTSIIENELGIQGTYYFRIVPDSFDKKIILKIHNLGHEIGYHYEDVDLVSKKDPSLLKGTLEELISESYHSFISNLNRLRELTTITTICMHGSPTAKHDNKIIWNKYNYKDIGIIGEPYLDLDFNEFGYLTDTGRRWNGERVSVRDKVLSKFNFNFKNTEDIMKNIDSLPPKIMITVHPQRWNDNIFLWLSELILQNSKNIIKKHLLVRK